MEWLFIAVLGLVFAVDICDAFSTERTSLSKYILHYEPLRYDSTEFLANHHRTRRSTDINAELHLNFHAHQRYFPLRLRRDVSLFSNSFAPSGNTFHPADVYEGHLANDAKSRVTGFVHNGIFEGRIKTSNGKQYHMEPASQYFDTPEFHSVIYDVDDINYPHPYGSNCGMKEETKKWMSGVQHSADDYVTYDPVGDHSKQESTAADVRVQHHRQRRSFDRSKTVCHLYMQADPTYTELFAKSQDRALHLMAQHVKEASIIYKQTDFSQNTIPEGIEFVIEKMIANTTATCSSASCAFASAQNIGVEKYLELNSEQDHNEFCLAYVFGYRDFSDGVLGLAWIGEPSGAAGGICETYRSFGGKMKSLNTGIVTTLNYGQDVPSRVTDITFAHEIGHNFGGKHDDTASSTCSPGSGGGGNFIMYPRATSGTDANNFKFSTCSRSSMWNVINAKSGCFAVPGGPICGNKIKEAGEECDCGWDGECSDQCCIAKGLTNACKLNSASMTTGAGPDCSMSDGVCCDSNTCKPVAANTKNCSLETECSQRSACNGATASCPAPAVKPNLDLCNNEAKVCLNGSCTGSICSINNQVECMCTTEANFCDICCRDDVNGSVCVSEGKKQVSGAPCDGYTGYCDIFSKCRKVDAEGPLSRLKNWLFSGSSIQNVIEWMKEYWWACVLIGLGIILLMAGFIKLCSVHTPSSNPNMKAARRVSIPRTLSRRRHPQTNPNAPRHPPTSGMGYPADGEHLPGYETALRQPVGKPVGGGHSMEMAGRQGYR